MAVTEEARSGDVPMHLRGNGAPTSQEHTLLDLPVTGALPRELDGRYLRNGANPLTGMSEHPFFGDGMVHGIRVRDGRAEWYRNRFVRTPFFANPQLNIMDPSVLMDMTCSKANTHVVGHAGCFYALEEGHFPYLLDGNLDTIGATDFGGRLKGSFTAHPKICPTTGEMVAFGYSFLEPYLTYLRVSATGELAQVENITVGGPTMMHDFNVTQNHVIFMDLPAVFSLEAAMKGDMPIRWDESYPARLGVMPRTGTDADVKWYDINPCYVFHPMNSYEDGDNIVLDVARFPYMWKSSGVDFPKPYLWRFIINTVTGRVSEEQVDDRSAEFPRVADANIARPYRYGYMMSASGRPDQPAEQAGAILKYDRHTGTRTSIEFGRGRVGGEPVFAPAENAKHEDDGYLMTFVYDAATDSSEYVVYDAASMDNEPLARVALPRVPSGFHGSWVPSSVAD